MLVDLNTSRRSAALPRTLTNQNALKRRGLTAEVKQEIRQGPRRAKAKQSDPEERPDAGKGSDPVQLRKGRTRLLTLPEQIAEQLARDIVNQALPPGQRLKELELSTRFDASRAPIREALRLLELRGLVQIESRRGVTVTQLSAAEVDDLYEMRASLLCLAARRVALSRDNDFLALAKAHLQRLKQQASAPLYGKYFEATYELCNLIGQAAGSPRLFSLIASFSQQVARYTRLSLEAPDRRKQSLKNWQRLMAAIEAQDPDAAERAQKALVFGSRDRVREIVARQLPSTMKAGA
jgi:DNA-binding GntR family transcriptional regulator